MYIFWWPHCPQTYITTYNTSITTYNTLSGGYVYFLVATLPTNLYITTYNTSITTYNTPIGGLCIFTGGHTAHKLISLHKTPLSGGSLYFLVATLPTNL